MSENPSNRRRDFDRMRARHRAAIERERRELERERKDFEERMSQLRAEMEAARQEFEELVGQGLDALTAARKYRERFGEWPEIKRRKRPPRRLEGGEPVPVRPRPKPTPLADGAEAPID
jgi:chromosome segregation ATPase